MTPFVDAQIGSATPTTTDAWEELLCSARALGSRLYDGLPPECPDDGGLIVIGKVNRIGATEIRRLHAAVEACERSRELRR